MKNLKLKFKINSLNTEYRKLNTLLIFALCLCTSVVKSDVHYVSKKGSDTFPYTSSETAARIIQDAVNAATDGDTVLVDDGTYKTGGAVAPGQTLMNRVMITNSIILKSVNGPKKTRIMGRKNAGNDNVRGVFLGTNSQLIGFTIKNGGTEKFETGGYEKNPKYDGGGIFAVYGNIVSNCIVCFNKCEHFGAGIYAKNADILFCLIKNNRSYEFGGGISCSDSVISNCYIKNNKVSGSSFGGGIDCNNTIVIDCIIEKNRGGGGVNSHSSSVINCKILKNKARGAGGGLSAGNTIISNCYIYNNIAKGYGCNSAGGVAGGYIYNSIIIKNRAIRGAAGGGVFGAKLYNCLIAENKVSGKEPIICERKIMGGGLYGSTAVNCTIVGNKARGRKAVCGGVANSVLTNSIVYFNTARTAPNYGTNSFFAYSCSYPKPNGEGNIDIDPLFVNIKKQDYHLQQNSPCINAGTNMDWMVGVVDLDNKPRISSSTVDIGAFENQ